MTLFEQDPEHHYGPQPPPGIENEPGVRIIWFDGTPAENPHGWFMSNFAPSTFKMSGRAISRLVHKEMVDGSPKPWPGLHKIVFHTGEAAFQAFKAVRHEDFLDIAQQKDPHEAKRLGQSPDLNLRPDWEDVKVDVMREVLRHKFSDQNPDLVSKLLGSAPAYCVEGNGWADFTWGIPVTWLTDGTAEVRSDGGLNLLGLATMQRRAELALRQAKLAKAWRKPVGLNSFGHPVNKAGLPTSAPEVSEDWPEWDAAFLDAISAPDSGGEKNIHMNSPVNQVLTYMGPVPDSLEQWRVHLAVGHRYSRDQVESLDLAGARSTHGYLHVIDGDPENDTDHQHDDDTVPWKYGNGSWAEEMQHLADDHGCPTLNHDYEHLVEMHTRLHEAE